MENAVIKYYESIDKGHVETALSMFSKNAVYERCNKRFIGKKRIKRFYSSERRILGRHHLELLTKKHNIMVVKGIFRGKDYRRKPIIIKFMDVFYFEKRCLVKRRETFVSRGLADIQNN
jgi:hypothetical protein